MARTRKALPARLDVAHLISAGVLASVCPRALIEEVLADNGKVSRRERLLPAPAVVYCVMALAHWREAMLAEIASGRAIRSNDGPSKGLHHGHVHEARVGGNQCQAALA